MTLFNAESFTLCISPAAVPSLPEPSLRLLVLLLSVPLFF